jgi:hypothetical protein
MRKYIATSIILGSLFPCTSSAQYYSQGYKQGVSDALDKIRAEIEQIADEEQKHDEKWAIGLRYAVKIIDKYKVEREE